MDKPKLSPYRWAVMIIVCLVCVLSNYMQYQVSALAVYIMPMFSIDEAGFSMLQFNIDTLKKESAYYISFTLLVIIRKKGEKSTSLKKPSSLKYKKLDRG